MKTYLLFLIVIILALVVSSCEPLATQAPVTLAPAVPTSSILDYPTASGLTPASLEPVIGTSDPVMAVGQDWDSYGDGELGFTLNYPPGWQALTLRDGPGVGLYPPKSNPDVPTPMIRIEWMDTVYSSDQPLIKTQSPINAIEISGITGRQYQDSKFAIPTQSHYIELPYRNGILFFVTTEGPTVDLTPQLREILKTFVFLDSASSAATEAASTGDNGFEVTVSATHGWQDTQINVQAGTTLTIETIGGEWTHWKGTQPYNPGEGGTYTCASVSRASQCVEPLPDDPQGALIGKVDGQIFRIGNANTITIQQTGILYLRINDGDEGLFDNDGNLTVRIVVSK